MTQHHARIEAALDRVDAAATQLDRRTAEALQRLGFVLPPRDDIEAFLREEGFWPTLADLHAQDIVELDTEWLNEEDEEHDAWREEMLQNPPPLDECGPPVDGT